MKEALLLGLHIFVKKGYLEFLILNYVVVLINTFCAPR